jgi:hypothetical protein
MRRLHRTRHDSASWAVDARRLDTVLGVGSETGEDQPQDGHGELVRVYPYDPQWPARSKVSGTCCSKRPASS